MICEKYENLSPSERVFFIGSICHMAQSDNAMFDTFQQLIELGTRKGLFDRVTINPNSKPNPDATNTD